MKAACTEQGAVPSHQGSLWWDLLSGQLKIRILDLRFNLINSASWMMMSMVELSECSQWLRSQPGPSSHLVFLSKVIRNYKIRKKKVVSKLSSFLFFLFWNLTTYVGEISQPPTLQKTYLENLNRKEPQFLHYSPKANGYVCECVCACTHARDPLTLILRDPLILIQL